MRNKRRRVDNDARACAAQSLLDLSESCNGSEYCELYSGIATSTKMERDNDSLRNENSRLHTKCEQQKGLIKQLTDENDLLRKEDHTLRDESHSCNERCKKMENSTATTENKLSELYYSESSLRDDDTKVKYYTGLPSFGVLMALFTLFRGHMEVTNRSALNLFQQLMLVLMKLRLNLGDQDLAFRFGVNQSTISRCISKWVDVMYVCLKALIKWPERELLMKTMPMDFRKSFKNCVTIIDCFEVLMERPTNLRARAQSWSNYKHNTVKFLIGIAPQGAITFISKGWGGRASDVHIIQKIVEFLNI